MKKASRIITAILIITLLLSSIPPAYASSYDPNTDIKKTIDSYFSLYYTGIENSSETYIVSAERMETTLDHTDSTYQFLTFYKWTKALLDQLDLNYQNCKTTVEYVNIDVQDNIATVYLNFDLTYNYSFSPDVESSLSDIQFVFTLKHEDSDWKITGIDTDLLDYNLFLTELSSYINAQTPEVAAIGKTENSSTIVSANEEMLDNFLAYKLNDIKTLESQAISSLENSDSLVNTQYENNNARASYSYSASTGASYAQKYAKADSDDRLFYTVSATSNDCTNFVSQCVWAAYGGYDSSSISTTQNNISSKKRMVSSSDYSQGWYAGTGGGSANWEQVNKFYDYVTSSKTYGPNGTGINNGAKWSSYPNYYNSVPIGTVIQFRKSSDTEYQHSVYASSVTENPTPDSTYGYFKTVLVSYHSTDTLNRSLMELIVAYGGSSCYMRGISFSSASFSS